MKATIAIAGFEPQEVEFEPQEVEFEEKPEPTGFVVWRKGAKPGGRVMLKLEDEEIGCACLHAVNQKGEPLPGGCLASFFSDGTARRDSGIADDIPIARDSEDRLSLDK